MPPAKLGIADLLAGGARTPAEISDTLGTDGAATARLLRSLSGLGVFTDAGDHGYTLTPLGETLTSDAPGSMRDLALMWMETHYVPFGGLVETVRTGRTAATQHYRMPFFTWLGQDPDLVARFTGAMANLTDGIKRHAVSGYEVGKPTRIVDVGGADGSLLALLLDRVPEATGISFDLPHVVEAVPAVAKAHELDDRLSGEGGDFFERVPGGADMYVLSMVLHDWDDEHASRLLRNIASAAPWVPWCGRSSWSCRRATGRTWPR